MDLNRVAAGKHILSTILFLKEYYTQSQEKQEEKSGRRNLVYTSQSHELRVFTGVATINMHDSEAVYYVVFTHNWYTHPTQA